MKNRLVEALHILPMYVSLQPHRLHANHTVLLGLHANQTVLLFTHLQMEVKT